MKSLKFIKFNGWLFVFLLFLGLNSCYKDHFDLNRLEQNNDWSPEIALPLIYSDLSMKDLLADYNHDNLIAESGNGFLTLVYWKNILSKKAEDLILIPNQNVNTSFAFSVPGALPIGTDITAAPFLVNFSFITPNNEEIDELYIKDGMLNFSVFSPNLNHNATIKVEIPSATLNGNSFSQNLEFTYGTNLTTQLNLNGYKIVFNNSGLNHNRLTIIYTITIHGSGLPNNSPYSIDLGESFTNIKFSKILGDFKQIPMEFPNDTLDIRIFGKNIHGRIHFENPMVHFYTDNSYGMPVNININTFRAISGWNPPYNITITGIPVPWYINPSSIVGGVTQTEFHLDKTNSNLVDALDISPQHFVTDISGLSNPAGGISTNFALDTSRININAQIELPLFGKCWDFILQDTIDLEFGEDMDKIEFLLFRINTTNGFPVEAIQQLYFVDENNAIIDSLLIPEQQTMLAAPCGGAPEYRVVSSVMKSTESKLEGNRILALENCKKIIVQAKLLTTQNGTQLVKIYSDYSLAMKVGLRTKFKVTF